MQERFKRMVLGVALVGNGLSLACGLAERWRRNRRRDCWWLRWGGSLIHRLHAPGSSSNLGSTATNIALSGLAGAGLTPDQALGTINRLVDQQAYMLAASDVFYVSALIFLLLIPLVYLTRHTQAGAGSADAAAGAH